MKIVGDELGLEDIEIGTSTLITKRTALERNPQSTKNAFKCGDVLYEKLRSCLLVQRVCRFRPNALLLNKYLYFSLSDESFRWCCSAGLLERKR